MASASKALVPGRVVVLGSINVDYVLRVPRRPGPGETVTDAVLEHHPGGKGANQAVAATRCGATVAMIAKVGADPSGAQRLAELAAAGVAIEDVQRTADAATGCAFITVTPDGENAIAVAPGANSTLSPAEVEAARATLSEADVAVAQLEVPLDAIERLAELLPATTRLVLNCSPWRALSPELLGRIDVLVVNEGEAAALSGLPVRDAKEASQAGVALRSRGCGSVVVTLGAQGAVVIGADVEDHLPAPSAHVIDTTGAGDAFTGALVARLAVNEPLREAVGFAVEVGSATTEQFGAAIVLPSSAHGDRAP